MCFQGSYGQESCSCNENIITGLKSTLTCDSALSTNFNINDVKPGTAAGFDGVYPEFIRNYGERTKEWLISFMNDVLYRSKSFKLAKASAIPKPGKDDSDPTQYQPVLLLSRCRKPN
jgi:hypothetical protein